MAFVEAAGQQTAWSCGAGGAFVSELSEEAQSKRRRLADRFSALIYDLSQGRFRP